MNNKNIIKETQSPHWIIRIFTILPDYFQAFQEQGVIRRAFMQNVTLYIHDIRDFSHNNYQRIDDRPYGGGAGMVMMALPLAQGIQSVSPNKKNRKVLLPSPQGYPLTQKMIANWVDLLNEGQELIFVCGRYEGIDQRFIDDYVDTSFSVGDFVVSGGELPSMMAIDALLRFYPNVLNTEESAIYDSFHEGLSGLLDCPHYTRPEKLPHDLFTQTNVPKVLTSGNHQQIAQWKVQQRTKQTQIFRQDLLSPIFSHS